MKESYRDLVLAQPILAQAIEDGSDTKLITLRHGPSRHSDLVSQFGVSVVATIR